MRKKINSVKIVDCLAEITRYHDREILERSLITTLANFLGDVDLCLYRIELIETRDEIELDMIMRINYKGDAIVNHEEVRHDADIQATKAIMDAIESASVSSCTDDREGYTTLYYPVFDRKDEVVSILSQTSRQIRFEDQQLTYGILKVYSNYLNLLEESQTDKLTGLLNRETLDQEILRIIAKASYRRDDQGDLGTSRRKADELISWLVLLDLDKFKKVNDDFGHMIGDEILVLFGRLMKDIFRSGDKLFRFGGEEFVIILESRNYEDCCSVLERFMGRLKSFDFPQAGQITATLGTVEIEKFATVSDVLDCADKALYYGKANGRDQLVMYADLVEKGIVEEKKALDNSNVSFFS